MAADALTGEPPRGTAAEPVERVNRLLDHWVPWAVLALLPLLLLMNRGRKIGDPDAFCHIRAGHDILESWRFTGPDPWTLGGSNVWGSTSGLPRPPWHCSTRPAGLPGVAWLWHAAMLGIVVAVFSACRPQGTLLQTLIGTLGPGSARPPA